MDKRPYTIFCDIDGTLVKHSTPIQAQDPNHSLELLDGTKEKLLEWDKNGYNIILTTGRKEGLRKSTEAQLARAGIIYDQLVMGIGGGKRFIVNDKKENSEEPYAIAINVERNKGIKNIEL